MNGSDFKVEFTGLAREQYRNALRRAKNASRSEELGTAMRTLVVQLTDTPTEIGEPMYRLHSMKMDVRRVALAPVYLEYGVHLSEPLVVIRRVVGMAKPD